MADEHQGTVTRVVDHAPGVRSLHLALAAPLRHLPGQFISCALPSGEQTLTRAYTIASHPADPLAIEIVFNLVPGGLGSTSLFGLTIGDVVHFTGPWGTFTLDTQPDAETIFVADGICIAPIRPMLARACATGTHPIHLLYGTGPNAPLLYQAELRALADRHARFTWSAVDTARLEAEVSAAFVAADEDRRRHFFVCAIGDRLRRLRRLIRDAGYDRHALHFERW
jgi:ferredoxin-NADP reductase